MNILLSLVLASFSYSMDFSAELSASCVSKKKDVAVFQSTHKFVSPNTYTVEATLSLSGEKIPLNDLLFAPMKDGEKDLGVMYVFNGGSVVIFNKVRGNANENGLVTLVKENGQYVEEWLVCTASAN